jgi:hypothetical protein
MTARQRCCADLRVRNSLVPLRSPYALPTCVFDGHVRVGGDCGDVTRLRDPALARYVLVGRGQPEAGHVGQPTNLVNRRDETLRWRRCPVKAVQTTFLKGESSADIAGAGLKHLPPTLLAGARRIKERWYLQAESSSGSPIS